MAQASAASDRDLALNKAIANAGVAFTGAMHRAGVSVVAGTDAPDSYLPLGPSLHAELANLVAAGLSPKLALIAATRESARLLGMTATRGTIAVGKHADLLLLDADQTADIAATRRIHAVIQSGRVLDRASLDRMLADVRAAADRRSRAGVSLCGTPHLSAGAADAADVRMHTTRRPVSSRSLTANGGSPSPFGVPASLNRRNLRNLRIS